VRQSLRSCGVVGLTVPAGVSRGRGPVAVDLEQGSQSAIDRARKRLGIES